MNKSRTTTLLGAALLLIAFGGCAREIIVRDRPPAARVEVIEARPSPAHVWIAGHWNWDGEWVWMKGHWEVPPHERGEWIPGHWVERPRGWVWEEGHWRD